MTRGVDDVDPGVLPLAGRGCAGDGDAPLLLLDHPVHGGGAFVDLTDFVVFARVVEDPLRRRGLARVDVGHDPDVAGPGEGEFSNGGGFGHGFLLGADWEADRAGPPLWNVLGSPDRIEPATYQLWRITSGSGRTPCWI